MDTYKYDKELKFFEIQFPFKDESFEMPDNYVTAYQRLLSLERKVKKHEDLRVKYHESMQENINNGYCELVTTEMMDESIRGKIWYLPVQTVYDPSRASTVCRIVYDASSVYKGISLNSQILPGPKLQLDLLELLIKFRAAKYTLTSDISKMFNQIRVAEQHRNYLRFLYRKSPNDTIGIYRFRTVPFGVNVSPFLAIMTVQTLCNLHMEKYPLTAQIIKDHTYVDDFIYAHNDIEHLKRVHKEMHELFELGGFQLKKFHSNSKELVSIIPKDKLHPATVSQFSNP